MNSISRRNLKVGVSGVRGVVGETLSPMLASDFSASFGAFSGRGSIIVGRDTRPSGEMLENAVVAGLLASGSMVLLAGIIPTPTLQIAVRKYEASGAIAVTASHNPSEWNALKFIDSSGCFLTDSGMNALLDIYNQPQNDSVPESGFRGIGTIGDAFASHADMILEQVDTELIRKAAFRVAVDCCNGVGALFSEHFLKKLGCAEVYPVFSDPSGCFERKPEPSAENLSALCEKVRSCGCDIGFAQDPDGDRISVVDETGTPLGEQYSTLIPAEHILSRTPGPVVANIQTTRALEDIAARFRVPFFYSKVGEINVSYEMRRKNAVCGAEGGSGGVLWNAIHPCRDSFSAMALTLEALALRKMKVSEIIRTYPHYYSAVRKLETDAQSAHAALHKMALKYASEKPILLDGIRLDFGDAWVLARQSNTEAMIRIHAESTRSREAAQDIAERFLRELREWTERNSG